MARGTHSNDLEAALRERNGALAVSEVANLLGTSPAKIRTWMAKNGLPGTAYGRNSTLSWPAVLAWYASNGGRSARTGHYVLCRVCAAPQP